MACRLYNTSEIDENGKPKEGAVGIDLNDDTAIKRFLLENLDKLPEDLLGGKPPISTTPEIEEEPTASKKIRSLFKRFEAEAEKTGRYTAEQVKQVAKVAKEYFTTTNRFSSNMADVIIEAAKNVEGGIEALWEDAASLDLGKAVTDSEFAVKSMMLSKIANYYNQIGDAETANEKYAFFFKAGTNAGKFTQAFSAQSHPEALIAWQKIKIYEGKEATLDRENQVSGKTNREIIGDIHSNLIEAVDNASKEVGNNKAVEKAADETAKKRTKRVSKAEYREKVKKDLRKAVDLLNEKLGIQIKPDDYTEANGLTVGSMINLIADAAVADKTVTETIEEAVDRVIKLLKDNGLISGDVNIPELKKSVTDRLQQNAEKKEKQQARAARKYIKEQLNEEYGVTLRKIVSEYYEDTNAFKGTLVDRLMIEGDLSQSEAKEFAAVVAKEYDKLIEETKQKIFDKIKELAPETSNTLAEKDRKKLYQKINTALSRGKIDKKAFQNLFSDTLGFVALTPEQEQKLSDFKDLLAIFPAGSDEYYRKLQQYNTFIDSLNANNKTGRFISRLMKELFYTNLLSGLGTLYTNVRGILHTATPLGLVSATIKGKGDAPRLYFEAMGNLIKGLQQGLPVAKQIIKDGFNSQYASEEAKTPITPLKALMAKPITESNVLEIGAKVIYAAPTYVVRTFIATDAFFKQGFREYFATIKAYDQLLHSGENRKAQDFWSKVHDIAQNNKADLDRYRAQAESELAQYKNKGISTSKNFVGIRINELQQAERDIDIANYAELMAQRATLNNRPEGTLGQVYDVLNSAQKIPVIFSVIPFIKIAINMQDTWLSYSPYGFKRAFLGRGFGQISDPEKAWNKYRMGKPINIGDYKSYQEWIDDRQLHLIRGAIGTAALAYFAACLKDLLDDDDKKSTWNIFEKVTANISDDPALAYQFQEKDNIKPYTVRLKGGFEFSYKESVLAPMLAWMGYAQDAKDYGETEKDKKGSNRLMAESFVNSSLFVKEQSFLQGFSAFAVIGGRYQNSLDTAPNTISKFSIGFIKNVLYPKLYESSYKGYKTLAGEPLYKPMNVSDDAVEGIAEQFSKNVPWLEKSIDNKVYDRLGYEVKADNFNVFPIPLFQQSGVEAMQSALGIKKESSPEWDLIFEKNGRLDYVIPTTDFNGNKLNTNQKNQLAIEVGKFVRKRISEEYNNLKSLDNIAFQKAIDDFASKGVSAYKDKIFGEKPVGSIEKNSVLDVVKKRTKKEAEKIKKED